MTWVQDLYNTHKNVTALYENQKKQSGNDIIDDKFPLSPEYHITREVKYRINIDTEGHFKGILKETEDNGDKKSGKKTRGVYMILPTNTENLRKSSNIAATPLFETLGCICPALESKKQVKSSKEKTLFRNVMFAWYNSYLDREDGNPVEKILPLIKFVDDYNKEENEAAILKAVKGDKDFDASGMTCFWVEEGKNGYPLFQDQTLIREWINYCLSQNSTDMEYSIISGEKEPKSTGNFMKMDGTIKMFSSNEGNASDAIICAGPRFGDIMESCNFGEISLYKVQNALTWIMHHYCTRISETEKVLLWSPTGKTVKSLSVFDDTEYDFVSFPGVNSINHFKTWLDDIVQNKETNVDLNKLLPNDNIVFMIIKQSSKGRMAPTFYSSMSVSRFRDKMNNWYECKDIALKKTGDTYSKEPAVCDIDTLLRGAYGVHSKNKDRGMEENKNAKNSLSKSFWTSVIYNKNLPNGIVSTLFTNATSKINNYSDREYENVIFASASAIRKRYYDITGKEIGTSISELHDDILHNRSFVYGRIAGFYHKKEQFLTKNYSDKTHAELVVPEMIEYPVKGLEKLTNRFMPLYSSMTRKEKMYFNGYVGNLFSDISPEDIGNTEKLGYLFVLGFRMEREKRKSADKENDNE